MNVGRNDPCPCGSGKKYKKCCLDRDQVRDKESPATAPTPPAVVGELRRALEEREFTSLQEAQGFTTRFMHNYNRRPEQDFAGLSAEQMFHLLHEPWESPQLLTFATRLPVPPEAPLWRLFAFLADAIGEKGLKPTVTGNLPRNFCREAALAFWGEEALREQTRFHGINTEGDFSELHVTRLVAELAGLVRKYRGRFILGRECRQLVLSAEGGVAVYPRLLEAFIREFNWGYQDRFPELEFVQRSFGFTLYLLQRFGDEERPHSFYVDANERAFPQLPGELPPGRLMQPEDVVRHCYTLRTLVRFADFCGLAQVTPVSDSIFCSDFRVRKLPLLDAAVRFNS